ncbi:MAG TPA: beta-L-arabinofuranosidase domain-containing protein [Bryobacteraceae bacterium]|nr:beta-L-arabinofuranosidase domain-containing protein [Bryobacteraceae bacterium]
MNRRVFVAGLAGGFAAGSARAQEQAAAVERIAPMARAGYRSKASDTADVSQWVQVDLGADRAIEAVRLYPVYDLSTGNCFPVRYRVEAAKEAGFEEPALIADCTGADDGNPGNEIRTFRARSVAGRYVRVTVTRLRKRRDAFDFGLAKLDVIAGGRDVAEGRPTADSATGALGVTELTRAPRPMGEGVHTDNPENVIPEREWRRVAYRAEAPRGGVELRGGVLKTALDTNVRYLLETWTFDELVREFRDRAGMGNPPGMRKQHPFWERDLAGSNAGRFLMGAGNAARWSGEPELRVRMNQVVETISECRQKNGYIMAYPEDSIFYSERGGYTRAWVTHGLIEAGYAGNWEAFGLLRGYYDWFDGCPYLPEMLRRAVQGVQGMIGNTRMYFTPQGRAEDVTAIQRYFQENYWLRQLAAREQRAIWQYPYDRPHCYLITDLEAYLDLYRATGAAIYLDAARGGWELYRKDWEHVGGTIAICEFGSYPPQSYLLHAETGELCGSVFWALLSQRFHLLEPEEEKYVGEIEKSIYNVALANQAGTEGIVYHAKLAGTKGDNPASYYAMHLNTCCAGQGTRLLGALPEFIYSTAADGIYVNLFESSRIEWKRGGETVGLEMETRFPFEPGVRLRVRAAGRFAVHVRVPGWATGAMAIEVNGKREATGQPGTYARLEREWKQGDTIAFTLPMGFRMTRYGGQEKIGNAWALEYGPILMAVTGEVDAQGGAAIPVRAEDLPGRLRAGERALEFTIDGDPRHRYVPYWQLDLGETFTCYPAFA